MSGPDVQSFPEKAKVVYPGYGVGTVAGHEQRIIGGTPRTFLVLTFDDAENVSIVRIPMDNVKGVGLRPLSSPEVVQEAIAFVDAGEPEILPSWKERFSLHGEMLAGGGLLAVAKVLKALWILNNRKPLSFREKKMYQKALLLLCSEIAESRSISRQQVEDLIHESLNRTYPAPAPK